MYLMLINDDSFVQGHSINQIMDEAIRQGFFDSEQDFVDSMECYQLYELPEPLKITAKIQEVIFTVEK